MDMGKLSYRAIRISNETNVISADDSRSDDEDEEEEVEEQDADETSTSKSKRKQSAYLNTRGSDQQAVAGAEKLRYIEVDGSTDDPAFVSRSNGVSRRVSKSSGVSLGLHKDVLNRIGCLSEEQLARERERKGHLVVRPASSGGF